jgi:hypothetical protein
MNDDNSIWRFILSALAVWRLTHFLAEEDGPWNLVVRLRSRLGRGFLGSLMDCFYCLSLWFSLPLAVWLANGGWIAILLHWQALSGAACLLERATGRRELPLPLMNTVEGDAACVVVRSEPR